MPLEEAGNGGVPYVHGTPVPEGFKLAMWHPAGNVRRPGVGTKGISLVLVPDDDGPSDTALLPEEERATWPADVSYPASKNSDVSILDVGDNWDDGDEPSRPAPGPDRAPTKLTAPVARGVPGVGTKNAGLLPEESSPQLNSSLTASSAESEDTSAHETSATSGSAFQENFPSAHSARREASHGKPSAKPAKDEEYADELSKVYRCLDDCLTAFHRAALAANMKGDLARVQLLQSIMANAVKLSGA